MKRIIALCLLLFVVLGSLSTVFAWDANTEPNGYVSISSGWLRLRSGPSTGYTEIGYLTKGMAVRIHMNGLQENGFYYISANCSNNKNHLDPIKDKSYFAYRYGYASSSYIRYY